MKYQRLIVVASILFTSTPLVFSATNPAKTPKDSSVAKAHLVHAEVRNYLAKQKNDVKKYTAGLTGTAKEKTIQELDYRIAKLNDRIKFYQNEKAKLQTP